MRVGTERFLIIQKVQATGRKARDSASLAFDH